MNDKELKKKIQEGYIHFRAIIEIVGKPKEYVEVTLNEYVTKIRSDENCLLVKEKSESPVEQDNYFSTFSEIEILVKDLPSVLSFCFDYMPSSIEILDPDSVLLKTNDFSDLLNDLQARLHSLNTGFLQLKEDSKFHIKNTAVLLRNFIVVLLASKPMSIEKIKPYLGIKEQDILKVLDIMIKEGKIQKQDEIYTLVK